MWLMDVSKQATGGIFIHLWNIVLSILFAQTLADSSDTSDQSDECAFYFLMFLFDTIFGVSFIWILLRLMKAIAESFGIESIKVQGYYGNPPSINWYLQQQLSFVIAIVGSKSIISTIMYVEVLPLQHIGNRIFQFLQMNPRCELIVVMIICPFFFNIIQYWIIDNFLSKNADATSVSETEVYELIH